jgi:transposase
MAGEKVYIGVDVSKECLDVYDPDGMWTLRARLAGQRDACRNRLGHLRDAFAVRAAQAVAGCLGRQVAAIGRECAAVIGADAGRAALYARLQTVTGVGPKTATAVAALLPEIAAPGDKPLAKLAGVAPFSSLFLVLSGLEWDLLMWARQ